MPSWRLIWLRRRCFRRRQPFTFGLLRLSLDRLSGLLVGLLVGLGDLLLLPVESALVRSTRAEEGMVSPFFLSLSINQASKQLHGFLRLLRHGCALRQRSSC